MHGIVALLSRARLSTETEKRLQADMAERFAAAGLVFEREVVVDGGVIDFLITAPGGRLASGESPGEIGIEVKIGGTAKDARRQLERYAEEPRIASFVLVTAKPLLMPSLIGGKRVAFVFLGRAWL
ncbi:MAG: hypothetical protein AB7K67_01030 [Hyphomicrobiaceae bacterium]